MSSDEITYWFIHDNVEEGENNVDDHHITLLEEEIKKLESNNKEHRLGIF
jgi:hypothetical protein